MFRTAVLQVQEALYGNVHSLTLGCGEALHRMLAC